MSLADSQDVPLGDLAALSARLASGGLTPSDVVEAVLAAIHADPGPGVWIHRVGAEELRERARALERIPDGAARLPLFGVPFAVKDNIDVAGLPTTAACPAFAYRPAVTAPAVQALLDAGAILVGKTNLDQFATGLVGTRSPYGVCRNAFDPEYVAGGSSSGSAVAVARRLVSFALGTDTAGSGRVPAAFNDLVGWKPTRGRVSTRGVVPACRSLDCVSVFTTSCADAARILPVISGFDPDDPWARATPAPPPPLGATFRFGIPSAPPDALFDDPEMQATWERAMARLEALGGVPVRVDLAPFLEAGALLYEGAWVAERYAAVGAFIEAHSQHVDPAVASIVLGARRLPAHAVFETMHRLRALAHRIEPVWREIDALVVPTTPGIPRVDEVLADPIARNTRLGRYTNFVNLLDLCALALPAGFVPRGLPFGVTLVAPPFRDEALLALGERFGADGAIERRAPPGLAARLPCLLAVVGAHLSGEPLHGELVALGARRVWSGRTEPSYRLYALADTQPPKPGLVRVAADGVAIEVEVYALDAAAFGTFVRQVPRPLAIGKVSLADGSRVPGFVCEPAALVGATDISEWGGWRAWRRR
ncbi:MAG: allophanate hydrolase [Deltaproteobacteria bacterium]|nr:allophanate hydrolase [Deltaproteobacteria bacterium]